MKPSQTPAPPLAPHLEATVESITRMHEAHHENATDAERWIERVTHMLGRPVFLVGLSLAITGWIGFNLLAPFLEVAPFDRPPFVWLLTGITVLAFYVVLLILITQRREEMLAQHQARLILQLTLLNDKKTTKIIALLEELRRDSPLLNDRLDQEAVAMTEHVDPDVMMDASKRFGAFDMGKRNP